MCYYYYSYYMLLYAVRCCHLDIHYPLPLYPPCPSIPLGFTVSCSQRRLSHHIYCSYLLLKACLALAVD